MTLPVEEIAHYQDRECEVIADSRYYPLVICDTMGVFTQPAVEFYFVKWRDQLAKYAAEHNEAIAAILNVGTVRPPPATVRKAAGEYAAKDSTTPGLLVTNIVVNNPLLRGVMTAIVWVAGSENTTVQYSTTMEQAIRTSMRALEAAGYQVPNLDPSAYKIPTWKK